MEHEWQIESDIQIYKGSDQKASKANLKSPGSREERTLS